jgi:hypothetical protein
MAAADAARRVGADPGSVYAMIKRYRPNHVHPIHNREYQPTSDVKEMLHIKLFTKQFNLLNSLQEKIGKTKSELVREGIDLLIKKYDSGNKKPVGWLTFDAANGNTNK